MPRPVVTVTDEGVARYVRRWFRPDIRESVRWRDLATVLIQADANLTGEEDLFVLLGARDGTGVALGYQEATRLGVMAYVQALPGYDHDAAFEVVAALQATRQVWPPDA